MDFKKEYPDSANIFVDVIETDDSESDSVSPSFLQIRSQEGVVVMSGDTKLTIKWKLVYSSEGGKTVYGGTQSITGGAEKSLLIYSGHEMFATVDTVNENEVSQFGPFNALYQSGLITTLEPQVVAYAIVNAKSLQVFVEALLFGEALQGIKALQLEPFSEGISETTAKLKKRNLVDQFEKDIANLVSRFDDGQQQLNAITLLVGKLKSRTWKTTLQEDVMKLQTTLTGARANKQKEDHVSNTAVCFAMFLVVAIVALVLLVVGFLLELSLLAASAGALEAVSCFGGCGSLYMHLRSLT